jgi:hypothetical protein
MEHLMFTLLQSVCFLFLVYLSMFSFAKEVGVAQSV